MSGDVLEAVARYYSRRIEENGPTPKGVDWRDAAAQDVRFDQLLRVVDRAMPGRRLIEFGCGYGALCDRLDTLSLAMDYEGLDISAAMLAQARGLHPERSGRRFTLGAVPTAPGDYCLASGLFNVRLTVGEDQWLEHVHAVIESLDRYSSHGFAFNCLTSYSDTNKRRPDLFYGDPLHFFDWCKRRYSGDVALLHDYGMYDFTIIVRKHG